MSTTANQDLSLGKLKRAVDGTDSYTTANTSLGAQNDGSSQTKMSDFSIDSVDSNTGYTYLWESTSETYELTFTNAGGLFTSKIGSRTENFDWLSSDGIASPAGGYQATVTAGAISNANTGTGDATDYFPAGTNNVTLTLRGRYNDDGQSDGYNDHATNYNTYRNKSITVVDAYGGSPSCLLVGTPIEMADGTTKLVEDLEIGDWVLSMNMPGQIDEDEKDWRSSRFEDSSKFTQHSASVQDINFDFSFNYWNINSGSELITGEHEMLYKPKTAVGELSEKWMWQLVPNMKVGDSLMDKNGNEVEITSLENNIDNDNGFEVVQVDVEPLDVYFGKTFLVHNKGSNTDPFA